MYAPVIVDFLPNPHNERRDLGVENFLVVFFQFQWHRILWLLEAGNKRNKETRPKLQMRVGLPLFKQALFKKIDLELCM